jgi:long-chain acyl-CoA synthetase
MTADTIVHRLHENSRIRPNAPAYFEKVGSTWVPTPWHEYVSQVRQAARALMTLGVEPNETVGILGFNRPEWSTMLLAAMSVQGAGAGIYTTNSPAEVQYIVHHADCRVVLLEDEHQWAKVNEMREQLPNLKHVVMMRGTKIDDPLVLDWQAFLAKGDETEDTALDARIEGIKPEDLASLIYTSGTTGPPKGVMLSHDTLAYTARTAVDLFDLDASERLVSYLPLSHIAEQMFTVHGGTTAGFSVYYAESIDKLADNLQEVQPTIFFGVPRVWERMYNAVSERLAESSGARAKIASWAMDVGREVTALRNRGEEPTGMLAMKYKLADRLVYSKVKPLLGMGKLDFAASGAAPINQEILEFFSGLDITIYEEYGQSEGCGPTTWNRPGATKFGTTGQAFPGVQVKLGPDGEVLAKGRIVFTGYYKDPEATNETLVDGWLHSGDLGRFDEDGFLTIVGRKKEIIITSGGKNIAPKNIEAALKNLDLVAEAVIIGERRKFLSALVTLDTENLQLFATANNLEGQELHTHPKVREEIQRGIDEEVNPQFARVENVRKFTILPRNFSVEDGELTPTLKIKRRVVNEHFSEYIEEMYAGLD